MRYFACVVAVLLACQTFTACSDDNDDSDVITQFTGRYYAGNSVSDTICYHTYIVNADSTGGARHDYYYEGKRIGSESEYFKWKNVKLENDSIDPKKIDLDIYNRTLTNVNGEKVNDKGYSKSYIKIVSLNQIEVARYNDSDTLVFRLSPVKY